METLEFKRFLLVFKKIIFGLVPLVVFIHSNIALSKEEVDLSYQVLPLNVTTLYGEFKVYLNFPQAKLSLAQHLTKTIVEELPKICDYFQSVPQTPVYVVIKSRSSEANGNATVFPYNIITLNDFPPLGQEHLSYTWNWQSNLILHEFTHIFHMDQTSGVLNVFRHIWGSAAKWGGIVPRWFIEGIAVWAETHFSPEGRLRDKHFLSHSHLVLNESKSCHTLDCLDSPGHFPKESYAYWAGASFLQYLENKKDGTIRCLVKANSDNIPFLLDHAFEECTTLSTQDAFAEFLELLKNKQKAPAAEKENINLIHDEEVINWQKGVLKKGKDLLLIVYNQKTQREYLQERDRKMHLIQSWELSKRIEFLQDYNEKKDLLLVSTYKGNGRSLSRKFFTFNLQNKEWGQSLKTPDHYQLFVPANTNKDKRLGIRYFHGEWNLYLYPFDVSDDFNQAEVEEKYLISKFKLETNLLSPLILDVENNSELFFITNDRQREKYAVNSIPLKNTQEDKKILKNPQEWFHEDKPLNYWGECFGKSVFAKTQDEKTEQTPLILLDRKNKTIQNYTYQIQTNVASTILWAKIIKKSEDSNGTSFLVFQTELNPNGLQLENNFCQIIQPTGDKKIVGFESENLNELPISFPWENYSNKMYSYPPLSSFFPSYWLIMYQASGLLNGIKAQTSLQDPLAKLNLSLAETYYPSLGKDAPNLNLNLRHFIFQFSGHYDQNYYRITSGKSLNFRESSELVLGAMFRVSELSGSTKLIYNKDRFKDFLSNRKQEKFGPLIEIFYQNTYPDLGLYQANLKTIVFNQKTRTFNSFWGIQSKLNSFFTFNRNHSLQMLLTYGRLFKSELKSGILLGGGGGQDFVFGPSFHEFYGLYLGDLYGNYILTSRLQYERILGRPYKGKWPIPFFLKEAQLLTGLSHAHSQNVFLGQNQMEGPNLVSAHLGTRLKMNWFYLLPVEMDLIVAKVLNNIPFNRPSMLFMLRSEYF